MPISDLTVLAEEMPDTAFYHYTSEIGLHGIIRSNGLRASSLAYMNDPFEIETGRLAFKELCDMLNTTEYSDINSAPMLAEIIEGSAASIIARDVYCCSLCSRPDGRDAASQWTKYGDKHNGYAIGIVAKGLLSTEQSKYGCFVRYTDHLQMAKSVLRRILEQVNEHHQQYPHVIPGREYLERLFDITVSYALPAFKSPAWTEEEEFRIMFDPEWTRHRGNQYLKRNFVRAGKKIPFFFLHPNFGHLLPITEIVIGSKRPTNDESNLRSYLDAQGYATVRIARSTC